MIWSLTEWNSLYNNFNLQGLCDGVIGPTLLDLKELYRTDLDKISLIVFLRSIGSLGGTFLGMSFVLNSDSLHICRLDLIYFWIKCLKVFYSLSYSHISFTCSNYTKVSLKLNCAWKGFFSNILSSKNYIILCSLFIHWGHLL